MLLCLSGDRMILLLTNLYMYYMSGSSKKIKMSPSSSVTEGLASVIVPGPAKGDEGIPKNWKKVGVVEKLFIYPLKSGKGLEMTKVKALQTGVADPDRPEQLRDRQLVVVNEKNRFQTGRKYPQMVLIETVILEEARFKLTAPGMDPLTVDLPTESQEIVKLTIWDEECEGVSLGREASRWISKFLEGDQEAGLKLLHHTLGGSTRPLKGDNPTTPNGKSEDVPLYGDGYPILLLSQESIQDLNSRLKSRQVDLKVDERRFRPNILIKDTMGSFSEDSWPWIKIGDAVFRTVKLCTRCLFTTVDPDKGVKHPSKEPLETLQSYRCTLNKYEKKLYGQSPLFATNIAVEHPGEIQVGDDVFAVEIEKQ